jgi:hypothetical protein
MQQSLDVKMPLPSREEAITARAEALANMDGDDPNGIMWYAHLADAEAEWNDRILRKYAYPEHFS